MNPDTNKFEALTEELSKKVDSLKLPGQLLRPNGEPVPQHWTQFQMDELVVIKNYTFRVKYIGESAILFEPIGPSDIWGGSK
jgi:hypothetical protein